MTQQLHRIAAKAFAENNIEALSIDLQVWRDTRSGLPDPSPLHELAKLCAVYATERDEYQEAERLVVLKALEEVKKVEQLRAQVATYKRLLDRLHPYVRGCDATLWNEYQTALKS